VRPAAAIAESNRTFELLAVKQLELIPDDVAFTMASPEVANSPTSPSLSLSDSAAGLSLGDGSARGAVALSADSTNMKGLYQRAQQIGTGAKAADPVRRIIGAQAPSSPHAGGEGGNSGNPLARRGSAVIKQQQEQQQQAQLQRPGGSEGSSLMAEVPDDMLSDYNIRPSEDVPASAPPARSDPFAARRLSPLKPSEKSQSLMADLMGGGGGGGGGGSSGGATGDNKKGSVWEDV
jgi:hypothetical protein